MGLQATKRDSKLLKLRDDRVVGRLPELCRQEGVVSVSRPASLIFALAARQELVS